MSSAYPPNTGQEYGQQYGPSYPPPNYGPPVARPEFRFDRLVQSWINVISHPRVITFDMEQARASWTAVWFGVLLMALVEALGAAFRWAAINALGVSNVTRDVVRSLYPGTSIEAQSAADPIGAFFGAIVAFFVGAALVYVAARALGGQGTFLTQTYLTSLAVVPLSIIAATVGWVPVLGWLASVATGIYTVVLLVVAVASSHRLSIGRSIVAIILPGIVLLSVIIMLAILFGLLVAIVVGIAR